MAYGENGRPFFRSLGYPDDVIEEILRSNETRHYTTTNQGVVEAAYIGWGFLYIYIFIYIFWLGYDGIILYLDGPYGGQHHTNITWGRRQKIMEDDWETCTKEQQNIIFCL